MLWAHKQPDLDHFECRVMKSGNTFQAKWPAEARIAGTLNSQYDSVSRKGDSKLKKCWETHYACLKEAWKCINSLKKRTSNDTSGGTQQTEESLHRVVRSVESEAWACLVVLEGASESSGVGTESVLGRGPGRGGLGGLRSWSLALHGNMGSTFWSFSQWNCSTPWTSCGKSCRWWGDAPIERILNCLIPNLEFVGEISLLFVEMVNAGARFWLSCGLLELTLREFEVGTHSDELLWSVTRFGSTPEKKVYHQIHIAEVTSVL